MWLCYSVLKYIWTKNNNLLLLWLVSYNIGCSSAQIKILKCWILFNLTTMNLQLFANCYRNCPLLWLKIKTMPNYNDSLTLQKFWHLPEINQPLPLDPGSSDRCRFCPLACRHLYGSSLNSHQTWSHLCFQSPCHQPLHLLLPSGHMWLSSQSYTSLKVAFDKAKDVQSASN